MVCSDRGSGGADDRAAGGSRDGGENPISQPGNNPNQCSGGGLNGGPDTAKAARCHAIQHVTRKDGGNCLRRWLFGGLRAPISGFLRFGAGRALGCQGESVVFCTSFQTGAPDCPRCADGARLPGATQARPRQGAPAGPYPCRCTASRPDGSTGRSGPPTRCPLANDRPGLLAWPCMGAMVPITR